MKGGKSFFEIKELTLKERASEFLCLAFVFFILLASFLKVMFF
jgi:hypothetical protein